MARFDSAGTFDDKQEDNPMPRSKTDPTPVRRTPERPQRREALEDEAPATAPQQPTLIRDRVTITIPRYMRPLG